MERAEERSGARLRMDEICRWMKSVDRLTVVKEGQVKYISGCRTEDIGSLIKFMKAVREWDDQEVG